MHGFFKEVDIPTDLGGSINLLHIPYLHESGQRIHLSREYVPKLVLDLIDFKQNIMLVCCECVPIFTCHTHHHSDNHSVLWNCETCEITTIFPKSDHTLFTQSHFIFLISLTSSRLFFPSSFTVSFHFLAISSGSSHPLLWNSPKPDWVWCFGLGYYFFGVSRSSRGGSRKRKRETQLLYFAVLLSLA